MSETELIDGVLYNVRYSRIGTKILSQVVEPGEVIEPKDYKLLKKIADKLGVVE